MNTPGRLGLKLEHLNFIVPIFPGEGEFAASSEQSLRGEEARPVASGNFSERFGFLTRSFPSALLFRAPTATKNTEDPSSSQTTRQSAAQQEGTQQHIQGLLTRAEQGQDQLEVLARAWSLAQGMDDASYLDEIWQQVTLILKNHFSPAARLAWLTLVYAELKVAGVTESNIYFREVKGWSRQLAEDFLNSSDSLTELQEALGFFLETQSYAQVRQICSRLQEHREGLLGDLEEKSGERSIEISEQILTIDLLVCGAERYLAKQAPSFVQDQGSESIWQQNFLEDWALVRATLQQLPEAGAGLSAGARLGEILFQYEAFFSDSSGSAALTSEYEALKQQANRAVSELLPETAGASASENSLRYEVKRDLQLLYANALDAHDVDMLQVLGNGENTVALVESLQIANALRLLGRERSAAWRSAHTTSSSGYLQVFDGVRRGQSLPNTEAESAQLLTEAVNSFQQAALLYVQLGIGERVEFCLQQADQLIAQMPVENRVLYLLDSVELYKQAGQTLKAGEVLAEIQALGEKYPEVRPLSQWAGVLLEIHEGRFEDARASLLKLPPGPQTTELQAQNDMALNRKRLADGLAVLDLVVMSQIVSREKNGIAWLTNEHGPEVWSDANRTAPRLMESYKKMMMGFQTAMLRGDVNSLEDLVNLKDWQGLEELLLETAAGGVLLESLRKLGDPTLSRAQVSKIYFELAFALSRAGEYGAALGLAETLRDQPGLESRVSGLLAWIPRDAAVTETLNALKNLSVFFADSEREALIQFGVGLASIGVGRVFRSVADAIYVGSTARRLGVSSQLLLLDPSRVMNLPKNFAAKRWFWRMGPEALGFTATGMGIEALRSGDADSLTWGNLTHGTGMAMVTFGLLHMRGMALNRVRDRALRLDGVTQRVWHSPGAARQIARRNASLSGLSRWSHSKVVDWSTRVGTLTLASYMEDGIDGALGHDGGPWLSLGERLFSAGVMDAQMWLAGKGVDLISHGRFGKMERKTETTYQNLVGLRNSLESFLPELSSLGYDSNSRDGRAVLSALMRYEQAGNTSAESIARVSQILSLETPPHQLRSVQLIEASTQWKMQRGSRGNIFQEIWSSLEWAGFSPEQQEALHQVILNRVASSSYDVGKGVYLQVREVVVAMKKAGWTRARGAILIGKVVLGAKTAQEIFQGLISLENIIVKLQPGETEGEVVLNPLQKRSLQIQQQGLDRLLSGEYAIKNLQRLDESLNKPSKQPIILNRPEDFDALLGSARPTTDATVGTSGAFLPGLGIFATGGNGVPDFFHAVPELLGSSTPVVALGLGSALLIGIGVGIARRRAGVNSDLTEQGEIEGDPEKLLGTAPAYSKILRSWQGVASTFGEMDSMVANFRQGSSRHSAEQHVAQTLGQAERLLSFAESVGAELHSVEDFSVRQRIALAVENKLSGLVRHLTTTRDESESQRRDTESLIQQAQRMKAQFKTMRQEENVSWVRPEGEVVASLDAPESTPSTVTPDNLIRTADVRLNALQESIPELFAEAETSYKQRRSERRADMEDLTQILRLVDEFSLRMNASNIAVELRGPLATRLESYLDQLQVLHAYIIDHDNSKTILGKTEAQLEFVRVVGEIGLREMNRDPHWAEKLPRWLSKVQLVNQEESMGWEITEADQVTLAALGVLQNIGSRVSDPEIRRILALQARRSAEYGSYEVVGVALDVYEALWRAPGHGDLNQANREILRNIGCTLQGEGPHRVYLEFSDEGSLLGFQDHGPGHFTKIPALIDGGGNLIWVHPMDLADSTGKARLIAAASGSISMTDGHLELWAREAHPEVRDALNGLYRATEAPRRQYYGRLSWQVERDLARLGVPMETLRGVTSKDPVGRMFEEIALWHGELKKKAPELSGTVNLILLYRDAQGVLRADLAQSTAQKGLYLPEGHTSIEGEILLRRDLVYDVGTGKEINQLTVSEVRVGDPWVREAVLGELERLGTPYDSFWYRAQRGIAAMVSAARRSGT